MIHRIIKMFSVVLVITAVIYISNVCAADSEWVTISGSVTTQDGTPLCAMVLANGQHMFTCDPAGEYHLYVPLDENGQITLFGFCDGFSPFKTVSDKWGTGFDIQMASCGNLSMTDAVYPMTADDNNNGINDYAEEATHYSGSVSARTSTKSHSDPSHGGDPVYEISKGTGLYNHVFTDVNNDGICDYAQNGSNTWHGPGFTDDDNNGVCDYWETGTTMYNRHQGIWFYDENQNMINDLYESQWHIGGNHNFTDADGDGICDYAQDGSSTWHGPGFTDDDDNGVCDYWEAGGKGYGHHQP